MPCFVTHCKTDRHSIHRKGLLLVLGILLSVQLLPQLVSADEQLFIDLVRTGNGNTLGIQVDTREVILEHIEIPLNHLQLFVGEGYPDYLSSALIDKEKGIYRWVLHPTDNKYKQKILNHLKQIGIKVKSGKYLMGYMTVSRSLIVHEPLSETYFSLKTSTDLAPGPWHDRPLQIRSSVSSLLMNDYLQHVSKTRKLDHTVFLPEPGLVTFPGVNLAQNFRIYNELNQNKARYFPLTAIFSSAGNKLAKEWLGPQSNFNDFRRELMIKMGQTIAEIFLVFGIIPSSSHWQNYLLRQDINDPKNIKLVWIDNADSHLYGPIVEAQGGKALLEHTKFINFSTRQIVNSKAQLIFSPMQGFVQDPSLGAGHPLRAYFNSQSERQAWQMPFVMGIQSEFERRMGQKPHVKNLSQGPHLIFELGPLELQGVECQSQLEPSPFAQPKSYSFEFPPSD